MALNNEDCSTDRIKMTESDLVPGLNFKIEKCKMTNNVLSP